MTMESGGFLAQAFVYLLAAVLAVPLAKRLGLGSVLGYLAAGVLIGPFVLGWVGDAANLMHFAEFGVVMMLFLVGLELRPSAVWRLRGPILGLGGAQVSLTALAIAGVALLAGLHWQTGLALGLVLAMSSTAIVLQSLAEKRLMKSEGGESAFSVLLFQDIAVIPIFALLPLLAVPEFAAEFSGAADPGGSGAGGAGWLAQLADWQQGLAIAGSIAAIVLGGRYLTRPVFRIVAESKQRELFTASALLLVVGVALAMEAVGLSPALGTFLAGVVLADNEYRHQLEADIEPFKGLLLGLFFISVGAGIDFALLSGRPLLVLALVAGLVALKFLVLFCLGFAFRLPRNEGFLFAFSLAQGGEFAFVLLAFALQSHVLGQELAGLFLMVVALSMAVSPLLMILNEKLVQVRFRKAMPEREHDAIEAGDARVIIAGFGRFGQVVGRLLLANGIQTTVLDHDPGQIETLRKFGFKVFYGDASRLELLHAAGAESADLLVLAIDDREATLDILREVREHFPKLPVLARAVDRVHAYEALRLGADSVHRETFGSAVEMGIVALRKLGFRAHNALRAGRTFHHHDEAAMHELAAMREDFGGYITRRAQMREELERILQKELRETTHETDSAWDGMLIERPD